MSIPAVEVSLRNSNRRAWYAAIVLASLLPLGGCIASPPGSNGGQTPTVSITPTNPSVPGGDVIVFTATSNAPSPAVTWYLGGTSGTQCGPAMTTLGLLTCGPAADQATYLAPATAPNPNAIQIVAQLSATNTFSNIATVTVTPSNVGITLSPTTPSVGPGGTVNFAASLSGTTYDEVGWEVNGVPNGNKTYGTITFVPATLQYSPNVTYTAPATIPTGVTSVTITAATVANPAQTATATVTFTTTTTTPTISISPATASVAAGGQQTFTANVSGETSPIVNWTVVGGPNYGTIAAGTPSTTATYMAPSSAPAGGGTVTIAAQLQGTSLTANSTVTITPAVVGISLQPTTATVASGGSQLFTATVTGTTNQAVNWLVVGGAHNGTIVSNPPNSLTATYTAPTLQSGASNQTVTVTAQSQADTTQQANATVTVTPPAAVTVSPPGASIPVGGTQQYTATEAGVANPTFNWTVSAQTGCTASSLGSIDNNGLYTAPPLTATLSASPCPVQITASVPGGGPSGSVLANLHVTITINNSSSTPNPTTIGAGANWLYTATVNGATVSNQGVSWFASGTQGVCEPGQSPLGSFPSSVPPYTDPDAGFYEAPVCLPQSPLTLTATSAFDTTQLQSTTVTVVPSDPLGTATSAAITCPAGIGGTTGATCYQLNVSCPGVADWPNTYLKVNQPSGTALGTVILGTGSGGNYAYDVDPDFLESDGITNGGLTVVDGILNASVPNAGYTTVQVAFSPLDNAAEFPDGWLTGPGGVRRLACRYATVAQWVYANIQDSNASVPMCATGNSGGAGAIAYALTDYAENNILSMVETTSGPPMTRLDLACVPSSQGTTMPFICNPGDQSQTLPLYYSLSDAAIIDPAYPAGEGFCSNAINQTGTQAPTGLFLSDMILGGPQPPKVSPTYVNIVLGGLDTTAAVQQAQKWGQALGLTQRICVEDAPHAVPSVPDGAAQIVSDIQNLCKLP
jgi:hypothetical protein